MNETQKLPSDRLRAPRHPVRTALIAVAAAAVLVGGGIGGHAYAQGQADQQAQQKQIVEQSVVFGSVGDTAADAATDTSSWQEAQVSAQAAKDEQDREAAAAALLAQQQAEAAAQQAAANGPHKCGYGYTANEVDGAGNESNCQKNGPGNAPCEEYNDANQCTAYLQALDVAPLE